MNWTTWSVSILTWTSTSRRSLLQPRERCWPGRRSGRIRVATRRRCASWARPRTAGVPGRSRATGSYGAGLARYLAGRGERVLEVSRTPRTERRLRGKDDALDAVRTARAALANETLALPRNGERREALRVVGRTPKRRRRTPRSARTASRRDRHRPRPAPRRAAAAPDRQLLERCSRLRRSNTTADEVATRLVLRSLARRINAATQEAGESSRRSSAMYRPSRPRCSTSQASARSSPRN